MQTKHVDVEQVSQHKMTNQLDKIKKLTTNDYKYGFITNIQENRIPDGLTEDTIISIRNSNDRIIYHIRFHLVSGLVYNFTNNIM